MNKKSYGEWLERFKDQEDHPYRQTAYELYCLDITDTEDYVQHLQSNIWFNLHHYL